jgi:hypothetical protein
MVYGNFTKGKKKSRKKSVFAKKGDPATRLGRKTRRKVKAGVARVKRVKKKIVIKPKKGVKKGVKRRQKRR